MSNSVLLCPAPPALPSAKPCWVRCRSGSNVFSKMDATGQGHGEQGSTRSLPGCSNKTSSLSPDRKDAPSCCSTGRGARQGHNLPYCSPGRARTTNCSASPCLPSSLPEIPQIFREDLTARQRMGELLLIKGGFKRPCTHSLCILTDTQSCR